MPEKTLKSLTENDVQLGSVINQITVGIVQCDLTGRLIIVNDKFCEIVGYPREELLGKHISALTPPDDLPQSLELFQKCAADGAAFTVEKRYVRKDGTPIWVKNSISPLPDAAGKPQYVMAVVIDITAEKLAQTALLQSEQRYRALIDASDQTVLTMSADGSRDLHRQWFSRLTGISVEELQGNKYLDVIHPDDRRQLQNVMSQLTQNPASYEVELRLRPKTSENYRFYNLRGVPVFQADGTLSEWIGAVTDITDRKEAESARRQIDKTKAHLAAIIESSSDAIISKDLNSVITTWNKGAEKIFGYTAAEAIGKSVTMLMPPNRIDEEPQILKRIKRGESMEHYETRRRRKDGTDIDISLTVSPIRDDDGNIIGASKIARDITEHKEAEEALRESQAILSLSMRSSRMGAWVQDIKTDYVWWSEELEEIFGLPKSSFSGSRSGFHEFVHPDDRLRIVEEVQQAIRERRDYTIEFRFLHTDGSVRWMEGRGQAFYSEKGEVVRLYGIGIDITERRQIQEQLIKSERRAAEDYQALLSRIVPLAQTLGTARDLISIYRSVNEFVRTSTPCNAFFVSFYDAENNLRTAAYVCGEEGEVDVSTLPPMLLTEDGGPNSQAVFQKKSVIVNRYMDSMKDRPHVILQEDGIDPMSSLVAPMAVMNRIIGTLEVQAYENDAFTEEHIVALEMVGNIAAVAIENVRLLQVEERARREAETANRAKDEFLSVLSHELRTPLNSMFGWTRMLRSGMLDEEKTRQAVEVIERNVRLQNSLIEDMLDVSRIITGKMRIEKEETDFAALVKSAVEAVRPQAEQKKVSLVFNSDADSYVLLGDEVRLQQIVSNLINNAVKFTPEDGAVVLNLSTTGAGFVLLNVTDTGIGIEPDFLPQIFDRFRQADSTTRRAHSGLGLGLTIVRHLTELHGGRVGAESEGIGKGASFTIELPLLPKPQADLVNNTAATENDNGFSLKGSRILLVDDDCDAMLPLQIILETREAEVLCASSVREALEKLAADKFNLLVSDIGMPEMDGYDLITALRKMDSSSNHDIPAIALTAYASMQDKRRALMSGFQHHFAKPLDFEQFLATVCSLIAHSKNR
ncbi:MAG TPA: PAS domain S-box protein [Pyrinomonadaceae bacterium]|jgi:PAS domain S-box-containing protein